MWFLKNLFEKLIAMLGDSNTAQPSNQQQNQQPQASTYRPQTSISLSEASRMEDEATSPKMTNSKPP